MDAMTYMPPLRGAVLWAVGLGRGAVPVATLARLAQVAPERAKAYGSILVAIGALVETPEGFEPGPGWEDWSAKPSRARPHQTTTPAASAEMDVMRRAIAVNVRDQLEQRGWSLRELSRRSGVHVQYVSQLTRYATPPPACHLVLIARALGATVEQLASRDAQMQPRAVG